MFLLQLKYETLRLWRSPFLWILVLFLVISVGFGLYNGSIKVAEKQHSTDQMLAVQKKDFENQKIQADSITQGLKKASGWWSDPTNVVGAMWWSGRVIALDPAPQSLLAVGASDLQPHAWRLTFWNKEARTDSELENPINLANGFFDLSFVIAFLLPLLVIALSFNLISKEREQGTLELQMAQPISMRHLFLQKMLARFSVLLLLSVGITLPSLACWDISIWSSAAWTTIGVTVAHTLFWFLLALGVNLRGGSSSKNALVCMGFWLVLTLVLPAFANMLAQKIHPVPSRAGFQTSIREIKSQVENQREQILNDYYSQHPNATRISEEEMNWYDWHQCKYYYKDEFLIGSIEKEKRDSLERWYDTKAEQQALFIDQLLLLSPTLCVHRQMTDLAGTSNRAFQPVMTFLQEVQTDWTSFFSEKFDANQGLAPADYDQLMNFPDRVPTDNSSIPFYGLLMLVLQCFLISIWIWWLGWKGQ